MENLTLPRLITRSLQLIAVLAFGILSFSCTPDEGVFATGSSADNDYGPSAIYRGVFTTQDSRYRGIFDLEISESTFEYEKSDYFAEANLTLPTGEVFSANLIRAEEVSKSSNFKLTFDSADFSFIFSLDVNDEPVISDVVFKNESGAIIASEETEDKTVTPVTGTYQCTNCEEKDSINGTSLNNDERTFNMLLTSKDGNNSMSIQAVLEILIDTEVVLQQSCNTVGEYTVCEFSNGIYGNNAPVTWTGFHRYKKNLETGENCSTVSGEITFNSPENGVIEGEFLSDNPCPSTSTSGFSN
ncbi:hypothetical protein [Autumnicola musiva]|uniref:Lipoprotein n=1 Tax=Autumnicola musiva TaxID=3075589 RepID=A0ABU3D256_9FLAO|nr:hypothetical protein [Zunongwangia sp. F117]MDT0675623.1 hypothetical protein [Zunongwangia sp. F117]